MNIIFAIFIALYIASFLVAFALERLAPEATEGTEWMTGPILWHFTGGLAVGALVL